MAGAIPCSFIEDAVTLTGFTASPSPTQFIVAFHGLPQATMVAKEWLKLCDMSSFRSSSTQWDRISGELRKWLDTRAMDNFLIDEPSTAHVQHSLICPPTWLMSIFASDSARALLLCSRIDSRQLNALDLAFQHTSLFAYATKRAVTAGVSVVMHKDKTLFQVLMVEIIHRTTLLLTRACFYAFDIGSKAHLAIVNGLLHSVNLVNTSTTATFYAVTVVGAIDHRIKSSSYFARAVWHLICQKLSLELQQQYLHTAENLDSFVKLQTAATNELPLQKQISKSLVHVGLKVRRLNHSTPQAVADLSETLVTTVSFAQQNKSRHEYEQEDSSAVLLTLRTSFQSQYRNAILRSIAPHFDIIDALVKYTLLSPWLACIKQVLHIDLWRAAVLMGTCELLTLSTSLSAYGVSVVQCADALRAERVATAAALLRTRELCQVDVRFHRGIMSLRQRHIDTLASIWNEMADLAAVAPCVTHALLLSFRSLSAPSPSLQMLRVSISLRRAISGHVACCHTLFDDLTSTVRAHLTLAAGSFDKHNGFIHSTELTFLRCAVDSPYVSEVIRFAGGHNGMHEFSGFLRTVLLVQLALRAQTPFSGDFCIDTADFLRNAKSGLDVQNLGYMVKDAIHNLLVQVFKQLSRRDV
mmetsp:Transcript_12914/g.38998  ORF Transcript_12914/g.38998 Transcript_12914/m.38998 type:complete len:640 (-) Transcript_12914:969-2888(-)